MRVLLKRIILWALDIQPDTIQSTELDALAKELKQ